MAYVLHCHVELAEHWQENGKHRLLARLPDIFTGIEAFGANIPALVAQGDAQLEREHRQYEVEERQRAMRTRGALKNPLGKAKSSWTS